ncbi:MAG: DUF4391 domain-containing protein [Clostridia bacterium]|nr:DUF4391 domain-containing protein [Clostridia bacterium]
MLEYEGNIQARTANKEASAGANAFKVHSYYHTDWTPETELPLKLEGLNTDTVYENFVRQIRGSVECEEWSEELSLRENIDRDARRQELQKQIDALQTKVRREKQLNKQVQLNTELKKLKREQEKL